MNRKGGNIIILLAVVVALTPTVPAKPAPEPPPPGRVAVARIHVVAGAVEGQRPSSGADGTRPIPLINFDEEMGGYVNRAREMIARKDYADAIEVLQALLNRPEQCFVPTDDPRRFVSLAGRVSEVIGQLPPKGMELYRRLYNPRAERLFHIAAERLDESALRDLVGRYFHTSYGDDALNLLGAILFDRGEFSQAAHCWRKIIYTYDGGQSKESRADEAVLLAKVAVAHHFAGESARSTDAMKQLAERHPEARAVLGGREVNVATFARRILAKPPPIAGLRYQEGWPSLAGAPDSVAVMGACRPVLSPRWTTPGGKLADNPNIRAALSTIPHASGRNTMVASVSLREGQVMFARSSGRSGGKGKRVAMSALIHPVVADKTVLYRSAGGIVAHDLLTGEKLWPAAFPLYRSGGTLRYRVSSLPAVEDTGQWTLTAGGGKVFAVGKFVPYSTLYYQLAGGRDPTRGGDTSALAAFSIAAQGRLLWQVGQGEGDTDLLRGGKFLTAPTYAAGRLYAVVEYAQAHHLVCLNAENGRTVWSAMVGQTPVSARYSRGYRQSQGSPPAVAAGKVFVTTNAGVIVAFEAGTGRALWAYQYDSSVNRPVNRFQPPASSGLSYPPNPIVVTKGRAICLPSDGEKLLALRTDTGELEWSTARRKQRDLTAVNDSQLLLSGGEILIVDAITGRDVWKAEGVKGVHGRPAVTSDAILASGAGEIIRVSLGDFAVARPPLVQPDAVLGNLICADGKLLAANAAGLSAYFTFEDACAELTQRIAKAPPKKIANLLYQRGMNAFYAERPTQALTDLQKARRSARRHNNSALLAKTGQALYRIHVSLADRAGETAAMVASYKKARDYAYSDRSRGEMLVRLTKCYGGASMPTQAVELAQRLTVSYAKIDLSDVKVGKAADEFVRDDADTARFSGYELGHRLIKWLIEKHGQRCYVAFDAVAGADLTAAVAADDPDAMVHVTDTYRHSVHAPMALLRAGESCYRRAMQADGQARREPLGLAGRYLGRIGREYPASGLAASARVGLVMVYHQMNPRMVGLLLPGLEDVPADARVAFADVSGSAEEVLRRFETHRRPHRPAAPVLPGPINPPLEKLFGGTEPTLVLRGADGQPLRAGGMLFLLRGGRVSLFDPTAGSFKEATGWETPPLLDTKHLYQRGFSSWAYSLLAGLSSDSAVLAVATRAGFAGVDTKTGKVLWQRPTSDKMVSQLNLMTMRDDRFVVLTRDGDIRVLEMRSGKELWKYKMAGRSGFSWHYVQIAGGLLLTRHVYRGQWRASVFDLTGGKLLGGIPLSQTGQAHLTADGLVVVSDGKSLRLIEPILGIGESVWSVPLAEKLRPAILAVTDTHVLVSPNIGSGVVELRSLAEMGRIVRTFQTRTMAGKTAIPIGAVVVGNRLYVIASAIVSSNRTAMLTNPFHYSRGGPSLHTFNATTGEALWSADLTPPGGRNYAYVMPLQVGRDHLGVLVKDTNYTRPPAMMIIEADTGKVAQKLSLAGVQNVDRRERHFRHMALASPVITDGRLVVETHKGLRVYGKRK